MAEKTLREAAADALSLIVKEFGGANDRCQGKCFCCDTIEALRTALENTQGEDREADDGWISVEDRKPPHTDWYWVYDGEWFGTAFIDDCGDWVHKWGTEEPTHWRALKPPQSGERGA